MLALLARDLHIDPAADALNVVFLRLFQIKETGQSSYRFLLSTDDGTGGFKRSFIVRCSGMVARSFPLFCVPFLRGQDL